MQLIKYFHELSLHPKNAKELKGLILQLAVQGKLTRDFRAAHPELREGSHSASALLEQIKAEKDHLIKKKKIKREQPLPVISPKEIPFELPEVWVWCRLGEITNYGNSIKKEPMDIHPNTWVLELEDIEKQSSRLIQKVRYSERRFKSTKNEFSKGDVIYGKLRPYLDKVIVADEPGFCTTEMIPMHSYGIINPEYLRCFLKSPIFIEYANNSTHGMRMPRLGTEKAQNSVLSLPPLPEQKAIVETVNQLFKEVEQLEQLTVERIQLKEQFVTSALNQMATNNTAREWAFLQEHFHPFFNHQPNIKKLRETILQLAVQGKLTSDFRLCHPELRVGSHSAAALLEQIKAEKARLVKEKKIKKENLLPAITSEEIPYELPEGWVWCRMQEIGLFQRGKSKHRPRNDYKLFAEGKYPLVQTGDVSKAKSTGGIIKSHKSCYNDLGLAQSKMWPAGTLCITIAANIAETGFLNYSACFPDSVVGFTSLNDDIVSRYIEYFIIVTKSDLERYAPSTAQKNINLGILFELKFPLPPFPEQKAIVETVNRLMALCDQLEQKVQHSEHQVELVMKGVLREVLG